jgi:hypothetical protein
MKNLFYISRGIKKQVLSAGVCVIFGCLVLVPVFSASADGISSKNVIQLVNQERLAQGLGALSENSLLSSAARDKLNDMIKNDYFAHTSPQGVSPWHWIEKSGYDYKYAGENLAINFSSAESQHKAWMASPTHRKNILNPSYKEIGVAVGQGKIDGENVVITVQLFGAVPGAIIRGEENKPAEQVAPAKDNAQLNDLKNITPFNWQATSLPLFPEKIEIKELQPEKIGASNPACQNGACYFKEVNGLMNQSGNISEGAAWLAVVIILGLSIVINALMLSRHENNNPFIAANTVVLLLVLTSLVFWKV